MASSSYVAPRRSSSSTGFQACYERVIADLRAKGRREQRDPDAYTGRDLAGASEDVYERCGRYPP